MGEIAFIALTAAAAGDTPADMPADSVADSIAAPPADPMELRRVAEVEVRRRLLAIPGVSQIVALGGRERQYQILVDPTLLERYQLTLDDVITAVERGNQSAPGGFVVEGGQESVVRVHGRAHGTGDLADIVVALRGGVPVRVGQLGQVRVGPAVPRGTGSYDARPAVILSVVKQTGADTLATTARVDAALAELAPALAQRDDLFRQADFIETSVGNLLTVLRDGVVLVVVVLFLFLWSLRPTLISALAIPLSLVTATLVLDALGMTLDTMTLGGLAIAIGELVDDAIVDVENVTRRLRARAPAR